MNGDDNKANVPACTSKKKKGALLALSIVGIVLSLIFMVVGTSYGEGLFLSSLALCSAIYFVTKAVSKKLALRILRIIGISICAISLVFAFIGFSNGDSLAAGMILFFTFFILLFAIDFIKEA